MLLDLYNCHIKSLKVNDCQLSKVTRSTSFGEKILKRTKQFQASNLRQGKKMHTTQSLMKLDWCTAKTEASQELNLGTNPWHLM